MFRSMKKKKKLAVGQTTRRSTVRRSSLLDDNDDDDENQNEKNDKRNENNDPVGVPKTIDREDKSIKDEDTNDGEESSSAQLSSALQNHKNKKHSQKKKRILGKRKTKGVVSLGLSFVVDDNDDNIDNDADGEQDPKKDKKKNKKKKHTKKRKKGLGFGGGGGFGGADDDDVIMRDTEKKEKEQQQTDEVSQHKNSEDNEDDDDGLQPPSYGKEALGRLKLEQQRQKIIRMPLMSPPSPLPSSAGVDVLLSTDDIIGKSNNNKAKKKSIPSESFISLNDFNNNNNNVNHQIEGMVLTGEDADNSYENYHFQKEEQENKNVNVNKENENKKKVFLTDRYSSSPPTKINEGTSESATWEAQIERRAFGSKSSSSTSTLKKNNNKVASLEELSTKLKSTLEMIQTQRTELDNSTNHRTVDYEHTLVELKLQQTTLQTTGVACEFYQKIRRELTMWVGALRELQTKIQPILQAYLEMYQIQNKDFHQEFLSWQNDCVSLLHEQNVIEIVLGRQMESQSSSTAHGAMIDEFGRDIRSQYLRDREIRFRKRKTKIQTCLDLDSVDVTVVDTDKNSNTRHPPKSSSDNIVDDAIDRIMFYGGDGNDDTDHQYNHNEGERSKTLQEAMTVALQDFDPKYTSIIELRQVFDHWIQTYSDDYHKCFATLSFGDLYAVLMQLELCHSTFCSDLVMAFNQQFKVNSNSNNVPSFPAKLHCLLKKNQEEEEGLVPKKTILSTTEKENQGRFVRAIEKGILPLMTKILKAEKKNSSHFGLFYSSTKSALLSQLLDMAIPQLRSGHVPQNSNLSSSSSSDTSDRPQNDVEKIQQLISIAIANCLEGIAIPILKKNSGTFKEEDGKNNNENTPTTDVDVATDVSIRFTSVYLVQILQRILCNIIMYWLPLLPLPVDDSVSSTSSSTTSKGENGIHVVFNFINDNYLQLLSSVGGDGNNNNESSSSSSSVSAKTLLVPVWDAIHRDERNIIDSPSLMLVTMPLRAAAHAYQLN